MMSYPVSHQKCGFCKLLWTYLLTRQSYLQVEVIGKIYLVDEKPA